MFILSGNFSFILWKWWGQIFILAECWLIGHSRIYATDYLISRTLCHTHSQFEEKFEDIQGAEPPPSYLSTSGFNENPSTTMVAEESRAKDIEMQEQNGHRMCSELNTSHDFVNGIMKIVHSDVNVICLSICCHCLQKDVRCQLFLFAGNVNNTCKRA